MKKLYGVGSVVLIKDNPLGDDDLIMRINGSKIENGIVYYLLDDKNWYPESRILRAL
jgi:hypothetical protein